MEIPSQNILSSIFLEGGSMNGNYHGTIVEEIFQAIPEMNERGLVFCSKFLSELLVEMCKRNKPSVLNLSKTEIKQMDPIQFLENTQILLAKTLFDMRDYPKAADVLKDCVGAKAVFLRHYALFLEGEKNKEEHRIRLQVEDDSVAPKNSEIEDLLDVMRRMIKEKTTSMDDGFNLYLYAIVLREMDQHDEALKVLLRSLHLCPCNWSAWQDLALLCPDVNNLLSLNLPDHWMKQLFLPHVMLELGQSEWSAKFYDLLCCIFPTSNYLMAQRGTAYFKIPDYNTAELIFEDLNQKDPLRLESMDIYSHILAASDQKVKLSVMAHNFSQHYKYRPETCCIIGNYYSARGQHEKAIQYFRRAVHLSPKYILALTLIGHEFVQLTKDRAALGAYRTAVEINPKDFRALIVLKMPMFALYYFEKAANIQPQEHKIWHAIGDQYWNLNMHGEAINSYERSEKINPHDAHTLTQLANLYQNIPFKSQSTQERAAYHWKKSLDLHDEEGVEEEKTIEALNFLADHCKNTGQLQRAERYFSRLLDYEGPTKEKAKSALRELHLLSSQNKN